MASIRVSYVEKKRDLGQERTHLEILKKTCVYTVVHHVKYVESAHLLSVAARPIKKDEVCVQHGR